LNIINTEQKEVGFGVRDNIVIGYFCPKANTDPASLKKTIPRERVAPKKPVITAGTLLKDGSKCPEIDADGKRPKCAEGLCCGMSMKTGSDEKKDHCKDESLSMFTEGNDQWSFECYDNATRLLMSLGSIIISLSMIYF